MTGTRESELASLRKLAEEMAKGRGERAHTGHLLAAIASKSGDAADLLKERRVDAEVRLKAARMLTDDHADAVSRAMQRARELVARSPLRGLAASRSARSARRRPTAPWHGRPSWIRAMPLTALNDSLRAVINEGAGVYVIAAPALVLAAWGVASFVAAPRLCRWQWTRRTGRQLVAPRALCCIADTASGPRATRSLIRR